MLEELSVLFSEPPKCIFLEDPSDKSHPGGQWLPGAYLNPAANCLSLNNKRALDDTAIIWRDEGHDDLPVKRMSVKELREDVWYATYLKISVEKKLMAFSIHVPKYSDLLLDWLNVSLQCGPF